MLCHGLSFHLPTLPSFLLSSFKKVYTQTVKLYTQTYAQALIILFLQSCLFCKYIYGKVRSIERLPVLGNIYPGGHIKPAKIIWSGSVKAITGRTQSSINAEGVNSIISYMVHKWCYKYPNGPWQEESRSWHSKPYLCSGYSLSEATSYWFSRNYLIILEASLQNHWKFINLIHAWLLKSTKPSLDYLVS